MPQWRADEPPRRIVSELRRHRIGEFPVEDRGDLESLGIDEDVGGSEVVAKEEERSIIVVIRAEFGDQFSDLSSCDVARSGCAAVVCDVALRVEM
jgi:hypothetical protein